MTPVVASEFPPRKASRIALIFLAFALICGGTLRALPILSHPFVVNDGGLFWAMVRALEANHFALPARVFYPTGSAPDLPFCYPPLGLYAAALLEKLGLPLTFIFRWLPWAWSVATIWAFWRLARVFCADKAEGDWAAGAATLVWSLMPWGFGWNIMGGGLTRAPSLVWALLAIAAALELWRDKKPDQSDWKRWLWLTLWLTLVFLTHLERARFAVVGVGLIWLFYGRGWRELRQLAGALVGAAIASAPWWGLCLARFGLAPFRAAASSGSSDWQLGHASFLEKTLSAAKITLTGEAVLPLFHIFAALGLLWLLWRRQWFLPVWVALILLLEVRSGRTFIIAPLALCFGLLMTQWPRARVGVVGIVTLWLLFVSNAFQSHLTGLTTDDLAAIRWIKTNSPPNARFLVMPNEDWSTEASAEWLPALAGRASVLTVQGAEWLPDHEFRRRIERHSRLFRQKTWQSVESSPDLPTFDWIWRPNNARQWEPDARWQKVWTRGNNAIWRRVK